MPASHAVPTDEASPLRRRLALSPLRRRLGRWFGQNPTRLLFAAVFLVGAGSFGTICATLVPPGLATDEQAHAFRSDSLANGELTGHPAATRFVDGSAGLATSVRIDPILGAIMNGFGPDGVRAIKLHDLVLSTYTDWSHTTVSAVVGPIGAWFPLVYLPSAAAMWLAPALGLLPSQAVLTGRLADLGGFLALGIAALLLAERGHAVLLTVLLLPAASSLAGSLNPEGLLIGAAVLAAALLGRRRGSVTARHATAAALCLLALARLAYLPLLLLLLLQRRDFGPRGGANRHVVALGLYALPVLAWWAFAWAAVLVPPSVPVGLAEFPALLLNSGRAISWDVAGRLGWLQVPLDGWLSAVWGVAALLAVVSDGIGGPIASFAPRLSELLLVAVALGAALLGLLLSQILYGAGTGTTGLPPHGLLPLLPFVALILPRFGFVHGNAARPMGILAPGLAACAGCMTLPFTFLYLYYLR